MKRDRIVPGVILVLIGALFLLRNFHLLQFHWINFLHLWPIFLVIGGINLVFAHNRSGWATFLKIGVVVLGFGLILFGDFGYRANWWPGHRYYYHHDDNGNYQNDGDNDDDDDDDSTATHHALKPVEGTSNYHTPFAAGTQNARLNLKGGASSYNLSDTSAQLFEADTKEYHQKYELNTHNDNGTAVVDFNLHSKDGSWVWDSGKGNHADIKLNARPLWDVVIEAGAADVNFDLSKFKVNSVRVSGGAGDFHVKLGNPVNDTHVEVSSGVSDVEISVPKNAACSIETHSGLSSDHFDGFTKTGDNTYETPGFANATNKIIINISGGLSDFKVKRY